MKKTYINLGIALVLSASLLAACGGAETKTEESTPVAEAAPEEAAAWEIPADATIAENPIAGNPESIVRGKEHYTMYCKSCHGDSFKGDGPAGAAVKAANLLEKVPTQTDGQIHYKLMTGKGAMMKIETYGLDANAGWDLINYLRSEIK